MLGKVGSDRRDWRVLRGLHRCVRRLGARSACPLAFFVSFAVFFVVFFVMSFFAFFFVSFVFSAFSPASGGSFGPLSLDRTHAINWAVGKQLLTPISLLCRTSDGRLTTCAHLE